MRQIKTGALLCAVFFIFCPVALSDEPQVMSIINRLEERVSALEQKVTEQDELIEAQKRKISGQELKISEYEGKLSSLQENYAEPAAQAGGAIAGIEIGAGGTMVVQGTNNVNYNGDGHTLKESRTDGSYSADITLGKEFEASGGKAFLHLEAGQGFGLENNLMLYSNVNRDAGNSEASVELTELWYEQALLDGALSIALGKLDPSAYFDQNEAANDETTQFLSRIFRNSAVLEFPDNSAGINVSFSPVEWLELGYGMFDAVAGWEKIFDNLFNIAQANIKPSISGLAGNYRFYVWNNASDHTKWGSLEVNKAAYGLGVSFDQKLHEAVTLFTRYGWQNPGTYNPDITAVDGSNYSVEHAWSTGFQVEGKPWNRDSDVFGVAIGQAIPSDDYKMTNPGLNARKEGHLEAYYKFQVNEHLSLSPDLQYIWNPFGGDAADDTSPIFVGGMRAQVDF